MSAHWIQSGVCGEGDNDTFVSGNLCFSSVSNLSPVVCVELNFYGRSFRVWA